VIEVVGALGMVFFLVGDGAAVGLDFSVRTERSFALAPRAVCEVDVLVQSEFGLSHENLQAG
jgi:hypothetical protein